MNSRMGGIVIAGLMAGGAAWAAEGQTPFHVENSLRVGYDDNVTYADTDKLDSFFITEQLTLSLDKVYEGGHVGLRYSPSLTWYEDLGGGSQSDWSHVADITWTHQLSRKLSLSLQDALFLYDRSDVMDADGTLRQANYGYLYNSPSLALNAILTPSTRLTGTVRNQMLRYDDELLAERDDYDTYAVGLSLGFQVGKSATLFVDGTYEDISYDGAGTTQEVFLPGYSKSIIREVPDRSAQTFSAGVGYENVFSPNLSGRVRAGYSGKNMDAANQADDSSPYGELSVTVSPVPTTRVTVSAAYSMYQSGLATFANQQRATFTANLAHDLTAEITLNLIGQYFTSEYNAENSVDLIEEASVTDGTEDAITAGARASYRVNRNNFVDVGYTYTKFSSDFTGRTEADRNRVDLGWRVRI